MQTDFLQNIMSEKHGEHYQMEIIEKKLEGNGI